MTSSIYADHALLPEGWARGVLLQWDSRGTLSHVTHGEPAPANVDIAAGPLLPGMPNLHSHAFQRGFAGLTETRSRRDDSFWSWRHLMYQFALRMTPEALEAIATQLYLEMLQAGYTSVCEFHYVHHREDGTPYSDSAEMTQRLIRAARRVGIGLTLLPVLYQSAGFGGITAQPDQRRFLHRTDEMLKLIGDLKRGIETETNGQIKVGMAPHSLRAVPPEALQAAVSGLHELDPTAPIHIHVAEQQKEVDDCLAWSGQRPVEWLLDNAPVDNRWCVIHATHMQEAETLALARSGAVAGLCPTTEANLGDGLFDAQRYLDAGGHWGIGSDSHASVSVTEELRLFEYGQRLTRQQRNVLATEAAPDVAERLYQQAVDGGAQASGRAIAGLAPGQQADFVVLDGASASLGGLMPAQALSAHIFSHRYAADIDEVWTAGKRRIAQGQHAQADTARRDFISARTDLLADTSPYM
jgi:formimidoylglutamate deiminase